jgi:hypothetical protein
MLTQSFWTGAARVHLEKLYNPVALTLQLLQRMFKIDCWTMGLGSSLPVTTPYMFHAYDLLALVKGLSPIRHVASLPLGLLTVRPSTSVVLYILSLLALTCRVCSSGTVDGHVLFNIVWHTLVGLESNSYPTRFVGSLATLAKDMLLLLASIFDESACRVSRLGYAAPIRTRQWILRRSQQ